MPLPLLCLGLTLLGTLQTQAQDSAPNLYPPEPLHKIPLEPNFRDNKFQGKWYVVGLAGNTLWKKPRTGVKMYSTTYQLTANHSFDVSYTVLRKHGYERQITTLVPGSRPGQFNVSNIQNFPNIRSYTVQVVATDHSQYAIMFFKKTLDNRVEFKTALYGRTKLLSSALREIFALFSDALGLRDEQIIFTVPLDDCIAD